ncbi:MAG: DUF4870 domain-containing protein [Acidobacteriia bacterium]|nr:DUF4870 domain-containing protein [Terriglobia bacterium]
MARFCSNCGAQLPDNANNCPGCGKPAGPSAGRGAAAPAAGGLTDNVAGLLAYVTIVPAIIFLVIEPYNRNRFIRFHAFQSIFFYVAWTILWVALTFVGAMPILGWAMILVWPLCGLGGLILWVLMLMKAYNGQMWKLPVIGDIAEKQANAM